MSKDNLPTLTPSVMEDIVARATEEATQALLSDPAVLAEQMEPIMEAVLPKVVEAVVPRVLSQVHDSMHNFASMDIVKKSVVLPVLPSIQEVQHTFALLSPAGEPHVSGHHLSEPSHPDPEVEIVSPSKRSLGIEHGCKKYRHALQMLYPYRCEDEDETGFYTRLDRVGFFSFMLFSWMNGFMWKAYKKGLRLQDMWKTSRFDRCDRNTERLQRIWLNEVKRRGEKASFFHACWVFCRTRTIIAALMYWLCLTLGFIGPTIFVQKLIEHANNKNQSAEAIKMGLLLVVGLAISELCRAIIFVGVWGIQYRTCVRLRSACMGLVYQKLLTLENLHQATTSGQLVDYISADVARVFEAMRQCLLMIGGPILMIGGTAYSVWLLGYMAFVGAGILLLFYPIQACLSRILAKLRRRSAQETDNRIHLMTEIINSMRLIKMYAWEEAFADKLAKMREEERRHLAKTSWTQSVNMSVTPLVPVIAAVATFISHLAVGEDLYPSQAFTLLTIYYCTRSAYYGMPFALRAYADAKPSCERLKAFNLLVVFYIMGSGGLRQITMSLLPIVAMRVACERMQKFLLVKPHVNTIIHTEFPIIALHLQSVTFSWEPIGELSEPNEKTHLRSSSRSNFAALYNVTFYVETGTLVGICGRVGAGKSSLFHGLLGQLYSAGGVFARRGRVAYVSQQAWLVNDTVRENICFGEPYDYKRYNEVVSVCSLMYDFAILPEGDQTFIGERGATLSGGQRQRVNLARAVYSNRDIYLLDDPLSAVDATVGQAIFDRCIMRYLRGNGKTVLLISGQIQYLEKCDQIFVFRTGEIVQRGIHSELKLEPGEYAELTAAVEKERTALSGGGLPGQTATPSLQPTGAVDVVKSKTNTVDGEEPSKQKVTMKTYGRYIKAAGGGFLFFGMMVLFAINAGLITFASWWLSYWLSNGADTRNETLADNTTIVIPFVRLHTETAWYPVVYVGTIIVVIIISVGRSYIYMKVTLGAAMVLHRKLFESLMGATMRFYDTTPVGRILTRLSTDTNEVDSEIPFVTEIFLQNAFYCLFALINIAVVFPWLIIAIVILGAILIIITRCFRSGVRDFKRLENNTTSPIISLAASTTQGLATINAYGRQKDLIERFEGLIDTNTFPVFCFHCAIRWLGVRLDFLTICFTILIAILIVLIPEKISSAQAGLTLSFAIQMSGIFQYTVRLALETEGRFTSVERIAEYIEGVPQEQQPKVEEPVPAEWPEKGKIVMEDVVLRYHESLAPALTGFSFTAEPAERIGIVGRTGSGKSSIAVALFRLVECEQGRVIIDGHYIKTLAPRTLRSRLSIIPQDPVLFAGTLRYNLDPFDQYKDEEIWTALTKVNLLVTVQELDGNLSHMVRENGGNFSVGERQLLCMARALLRKSRILFMDEATASIDSRTDNLLQETIKTAFEGCTLLTVAHRLNTVINYDRIMVVRDGKVVEFDKPSVLMGNPASVFAGMVNSSLSASR